MQRDERLTYSINTVCTSSDGLQYFASGNSVPGFVSGSNFSFKTGRLVSAPGGDVRGSDSVLWTVGGPARSSSVALPANGGIAMGGGGLPRFQVYDQSNGGKVWAHNHQNVTDLAVTSSRLISVGTLQSRRGDSDFV